MIDLLDQIPKKYLYPELTRYDIINRFIEIRKYNSYLEIGVQYGACFKEVKCKIKHSVDPEHKATFQVTSDEFFKTNKRKYDIIFLDGFHTSKQMYKDIENSLKILQKGGVIIVHDCLPVCEEMQQVPRISKQWTGDVWKGVVKAKTKLKIKLKVVDTDFGVGIIEKGQEEISPNIINLTFDNFLRYKDHWLNIIDVEGFNKIYNRL